VAAVRRIVRRIDVQQREFLGSDVKIQGVYVWRAKRAQEDVIGAGCMSFINADETYVGANA